MLGVVAGTALFLNIALVASTTGVVFPDAAAAVRSRSCDDRWVFNTMLSDLMGNLIYLGFATLVIHRLF